MERPAVNPTTVQFGLFEVDLQARELRKSGVKIKLHEQPFQVLAVLLERAGEIVTREELQARLWPANTFVDFDLSLNSAVKKLRQALGDESDNPRFVETLYRRGYRFIAPVSIVGRQNGAAAELRASGEEFESAGAPSNPARSPGRGVRAWTRRRGRWLAAGCGMLLLFGGLLLYAWMPRPSPRVLGITQITSGGKVHQLSALVTDGRRLYFQAVERDRIALGEVSVSGGESVLIASPFQVTFLSDIAPDGSSLLIGDFQGTNKEGSAWLLPLPAGPARPLGNITAHSAVWAPGGRQILFAKGTEVFEANPDGSNPKKIAGFGGRVGDIRLSPDGERIRFTLNDLKTGFSPLWEMRRDGSRQHPLLPRWSDSPQECCGTWTPDGKYFLFASFREGKTSLWALPEKRWWIQGEPQPVQLTNGPLDFWLPVPSKDGKKIFAIGGLARSEVLHYDGRAFVPYLGGVSAADLAFSAEKRVAYVSVPEQVLWSSKADGSDRVQLTGLGGMEAALPRWSPDGSQIVFMARTPNTDWRAYLVSADGRDLRELIPGATAGFDPNWSPDGKSIVLATGDIGVTSNKVSILELSTQTLTPVPGEKICFRPDGLPKDALLQRSRRTRRL